MNGAGGLRLARRVRRLEAATPDPARAAALARWIADRHGVAVEEVLAEARRLRDEGWREGAAAEAIVAREFGMTVPEVRAGAARMLAEAEAAGA